MQACCHWRARSSGSGVLRRQLLQQAASRSPSAASQRVPNCSGLLEVGVQAVGERAAGQRRNALVALAWCGSTVMASEPLPSRRSKSLAVARSAPWAIPATSPRAAALGHQQGNLAAGAGLQDQSALKLRGVAQQTAAASNSPSSRPTPGAYWCMAVISRKLASSFDTFTADVRMFEQESTAWSAGVGVGMRSGSLMGCYCKSKTVFWLHG